ncbi:MAG: HAMP domain-containing protein [Candidatus Tantalella remota]|nr:HAMP domain-containing protein [Candidatus Tantalella remota]
MLIPTVFVGGCLYYFIFTVMAEQIALPDVIARDLLPVIREINFVLAIGLPVVFMLLLAWAVMLSYRFVAPLERLEEDLQRIDEGDYSVRLQMSRDHDLSPITDVINDLVQQLEQHKGGTA